MGLSSFLLKVFFLGKPVYCRQNTCVKILSKENEYVVQVDVARTFLEKVRGLMFRDNLQEDEGMLFIFRTDAIRSFWMKNTKLSLDIIFIDHTRQIINIEQNVACGNDPSETYSSTRPARYVLEVNAGYTAKRHITIGDSISMNFT